MSTNFSELSRSPYYCRTANAQGQVIIQEQPQQRRRPGRPKGSKNKRPRFELAVANKANYPPGQYFHYPPPPGTIPMQPHPPPHPFVLPAAPNSSEPGSQQFYDFQWRVLTLCTEFYNAADELIVSWIRQHGSSYPV